MPRRPWETTLHCSVLAFAMLLTGCGKNDASTPAVSNGESERSSTSQPSTASATRPSAVLRLNGEPILFPAAKLVIVKKGAGLNAIFCSDDPPTAIEPSYSGNSFMIDMKLDIDDAVDLPDATWVHKADKREAQDITSGIFINGTKRQLQPYDVKITFTKSADGLITNINGEFYELNSRESVSSGTIVKVSGQLDTVVQER